MKELVNLVRKWANDRNLVVGSNPQAQTVKLLEECGELAGGVARNKRDVVKDSIGDATVVLIILAAQYNMSFEDCLQSAYDEIKDRKGKMVDGVFVKEE